MRRSHPRSKKRRAPAGVDALRQARKRPPWALATGWRRTWQRFHGDWEALPKRARHGWLLGLTAGWGVVALVMVALARLGERVLPPLAAAETALLEHLIAWSPFPFDYAIFLESPGNAVVLIAVTLLSALTAVHLGQPLRALSLLAAFFMLALVVVLGWALWDRARPDVIAEGLASPSLNAFPSGHTALATAVYGLLVAFWVQATKNTLEKALAVGLGLLLVATTALARLVLGAHWPSDLVAGAVIGALWLVCLLSVLARAERRAALDGDCALLRITGAPPR